MLRAEHPHMDLRLTEAEPPEALRMLRAGYVDVALIFRHCQQQAPAIPAGKDEEGTRGRLLLDEPVHLVTRARTAPAATAGGPGAEGPGARGTAGGPGGLDLARYAGHRWIAGCDRCRVNLITQCSRAGFTPKIAFTTDDYVAVQALVAAGLGVATLPDLALRAARHPAIRTAELPGARRQVFALLYGEPPDPPATARLVEALCAAAGALAAMAAPHTSVAAPGPRPAPGPHAATAAADRDLVAPAP
jgi:DNA-binding transcriptional LysR family regulator